MKNEVNRAGKAKKARYIVLGLVMSLALSVQARVFLAGDQIRVHTDQTKTHDSSTDPSEAEHMFKWDDGYAVLWLYLFGTSGNEWVKLNYLEDGLFVADMPAGKNYDHLILVRKNPAYPDASFSDDSNVMWNRTCDLEIPSHDGFNVLYKFWKGGDGCQGAADWHVYAPSINDIKATVSGVTQEDVKVCPNAAGTMYVLHPKLKSNKSEYDYDNVIRHSWLYSTDKTNWTSLDGFADNANHAKGKERNDENDRDYPNTLPDPIPSGGVYYYLYSFNPAGRRLIHITPDSPDCDLDCEITAFETAVSNVNADDNTYTLDGMVAFGKANGSLVIECDGKSDTILAPQSPQSFSLHGVPAAMTDGKKTTATAYFIGDKTNCSKTINIDVPNAREAVTVTSMDSLTGKTFVLTPKDYDPANLYVWLADGDTIKGAPQVLVIDPYGKDSTTTYTYKEYFPASGSMDDIMENGDYEDASWNYNTKKVSEYDYWGYYPETSTTQINFYTDTLPGGKNYPAKYTDNGFAVVRNANNFYPTYAKVVAKSGNNFALFDAASGETGANKMAWYATTADNAKLKLQQGTTYVLSFWAANINNYGEMDNAAKFKFYIEDITNPAKPVKIDSSEVLDLSKAQYRNNLWHQCSKTVLAKKDYNNIRISVVNLNNRKLSIGNDFALDDIQFHPISTVSKVVKSQQQFVVKAHEPKVDAFTATVVPLDCDAAPNYTIKMHVEYQNPKGKLVIKDVTNGTEYPYTLPAVAFDTKVNLDKDIVITGLTPATHTWEAYFDEWTTAKISGVKTDAPAVPTIDTVKTAFSEPGCTDLYTTLTWDLNYTYQQGTFTYWVDGKSAQTTTYSEADKTQQTLSNLTFAGIPADGKNDHVLHVSFAGANSCIKTYTLPAVPFSPVITSVTVSGVPATVSCPAKDYTVTVDIVTPYDATGRNIVLSGAKDTTVVATGTKTTVSFKKQDIGGLAQSVTAAYEATPACTKTSDPFTPPTEQACHVYRDTICEGDNYTDNGFNIIAPPIGETVHVNASKDTLYLLVADGHSMYSKWTDVLFIDNSDGSVVAYQWYENGTLLPGETQQRLYNPAGLSGTYYCVMTKTDGSKISTCEKAFDKVTPSRTAGSAPGAAVIRKVRVSPHVYIIQESTGDEIRTRKILTPYE